MINWKHPTIIASVIGPVIGGMFLLAVNLLNHNSNTVAPSARPQTIGIIAPMNQGSNSAASSTQSQSIGMANSMNQESNFLHPRKQPHSVGIDIEGGSGFIVEGNTVIGFDSGIQIKNSSDNVLSNNKVIGK